MPDVDGGRGSFDAESRGEFGMLFVAAEAREFSGFLPRCGDLGDPGWPLNFARIGVWRKSPVALVAHGAGRRHAARAVDVALERSAFQAVCSIGFCGALADGLEIADIVVAEYVNGQPIHTPRARPECFVGNLVSIDRVAQSADEKLELGLRGIAVEMEADGVRERAGHYRLPCFAVRSVSDLASETFVNDFNAALRPDGSFNTGRLVWGALWKPFKRFPELIRLQRHCGKAAKSLGEFLDNCEF